jgi:hypothetical protein
MYIFINIYLNININELRNWCNFHFKHHILPPVWSNRRPEWFHSSDNALEGYYIMNALNIDKQLYNTPFTFVDIELLNVAVWNSYPHKKNRPPYNYTIKPLKETTQYKYICGNKEPYKHFIIHCDPRNLNDFENLIKSFDYKGYNNCDDPNKLINIGIRDNNELLIIDGCHRASLLLFHKVKYVKVHIRKIKYPFYGIN